MTTIYLVRHCEASGNQAQIFQGSFDGTVSEMGEKQLEYLRRRFAEIPLDAIYTSPLSRAKRTAEAIRGDRAISITEEPRMREIGGGDWERRKWADLLTEFPQQSRRWLQEPHRFVAPNGEPMTEVYARVAAAMEDLAKRHDGQTIAVASHGCAIRNALCFIHGQPVERLNDFKWSNHTAVTLLSYDRGVWTAVYENDDSHIPADVAASAERKSWWRGETEAE